MLLHVAPPSVLISHLTTLPTLPVKVIVPVLEVAHTVVSLLVTPATVKLSIVITTVSLLSAQIPLLIVHSKEYTPGTRLVIVALFAVALLKLTVVGPLTCAHVPAPLVGVLPANVYVDGKQIVASGPALDAVTACSTVIIVVSE